MGREAGEPNEQAIDMPSEKPGQHGTAKVGSRPTARSEEGRKHRHYVKRWHFHEIDDAWKRVNPLDAAAG
jgi:hypothetical protein